MAKTIGKEKGVAARTRAARAASPVREAPTDEPRDGATLLAEPDGWVDDGSVSDAPAVDPTVDDEADMADSGAVDDGAEYADDGNDDLALALPADHRAAPPQLRVARAASVPAPLMANPVTRWFAEAYLELLKVTWPTPREAWNMTLVVVAISAFIAVVLGLADLGLQQGFSWLISHGLGQ